MSNRTITGLYKEVVPGDFKPKNHFYASVEDARLHPVVSEFLTWGNDRTLARYMALNPGVTEKLGDILSYRPKHLFWAGTDVLKVTDLNGHGQMIVIETNSCPSGQKSMPLDEGHSSFRGYGLLVESTFKDVVSSVNHDLGGLAVVFDKNPIEASGYASTIASIMKEKVYLVEFYESDADPPVKWIDQVMFIRDTAGAWPIRACFRYVTQKPWDRFPVQSKTVVLNSTIACLAGGRNKAMAAQAYDLYNAQLREDEAGIQIRIPETFRDLLKSDVHDMVSSMGGHAVLKVPYSNAGQGVYTMTHEQELQAFMSIPHPYEKFVVQNHENHSYVFDLRFMVAGSPSSNGFRPVALYARHARKPLAKIISGAEDSWEMLGTNLSVKTKVAGGHTTWATETERLLPMDEKNFPSLGLSVDDLIDAYIQTVLSVIAIDNMCERLMPDTSQNSVVVEPMRRNSGAQPERNLVMGIAKRFRGVFDSEMFQTLTRDKVLFDEIMF